MTVTIEDKSYEVFDDIGVGATTVFDGWAKENGLDSIRGAAGLIRTQPDLEHAEDALAGMRVICDRIAKMDIIDLSWNEWFSIFACQTRPIMSGDVFNRWTNVEEADECKKKLLKALNPSTRLESHLRRLDVYDLIYPNGPKST